MERKGHGKLEGKDMESRAKTNLTTAGKKSSSLCLIKVEVTHGERTAQWTVISKFRGSLI